MSARFALPEPRPIAQPESVLRGEHWRITVLLDGLLRLEWSEDGEFEDRASTFAVDRDHPTPAFTVRESADQLEITTERLHLSWDRQPFSPAGLLVRVRGRVSDHGALWRWGTTPETLGGTGRTLDGADGAIPLEAGVASRDGIAIVDDSESFLFTEAGWIGSRRPGRADVYVFAYGHDYPAAVQALYAVSGRQPVLPRWTLGNWWSRYRAYSAQEYLDLLDRFDDEHVPFSVGVLDMDWHRVTSVPEQYGTGWTGYSWERSLFPDPEAFLSALHERGLHTTLNLHPHEGVQPFEDAYEAMSDALGLDPTTDLGVPFAITDERFAAAYLDVLHHPHEEMGVDFWWIDWQQGNLSNIPGVDPLWLLNYLHFVDSARDGRRGLIFSRYAGPGSHRYPIGFSGDAMITWDSLRFQPEFTSTASNIGYGWWSHDIGGHYGGVRDDNLTVRWAQLGVFSPINRLHSSSNPFLQKEPWSFPRQARDALGSALRFRHRLVPYLHSMNHRAAHGEPLVQPMYYGHPETDAAYDVPRQFMFGDSLLVAPITDPDDTLTGLGSTRAWLPEGTWADIFTGAIYRAGPGGRHITLHRDGSSIPALIAAGACLPLAHSAAHPVDSNPDELDLILLVGADGVRELVEDDGTGTRPENIPTSRTGFAWDDTRRILTIRAATNSQVVPARRTWNITFMGLHRPESVDVTGAVVPTGIRRAPGGWSVTLSDVPTDTDVRVSVRGAGEVSGSGKGPRLFERLARAQWEHESKWAVWKVIESGTSDLDTVAQLQALELPPAMLSALTEILVSEGID